MTQIAARNICFLRHSSYVVSSHSLSEPFLFHLVSQHSCRVILLFNQDQLCWYNTDFKTGMSKDIFRLCVGDFLEMICKIKKNIVVSIKMKDGSLYSVKTTDEKILDLEM